MASWAPSLRKKGTSAPIVAASSCNASSPSGVATGLVREAKRGRRVATASAEAGCDGDALVDADAPASSFSGDVPQRRQRGTHDGVLEAVRR